jgi:hypothetical protein
MEAAMRGELICLNTQQGLSLDSSLVKATAAIQIAKSGKFLNQIKNQNEKLLASELLQIKDQFAKRVAQAEIRLLTLHLEREVAREKSWLAKVEEIQGNVFTYAASVVTMLFDESLGKDRLKVPFAKILKLAAEVLPQGKPFSINYNELDEDAVQKAFRTLGTEENSLFSSTKGFSLNISNDLPQGRLRFESRTGGFELDTLTLIEAIFEAFSKSPLSVNMCESDRRESQLSFVF